MGDYSKNYIANGAVINGELEQLVQLLRIVWDGDLISKGHRDALVKKGFALKVGGYNIITADGIKWISDERIITP